MQFKSAKLEVAIARFVTEEATLEQAAAIAEISQTAFLQELGARSIPLHYDREELEEDLRLVESFNCS